MAILKKFIGANTVGAEKIQLENNSALVSLNAAGSAEVSLLKLDGSDVLQFMTLPQVSSDPAAANDIVRKSYVDAEIAGAAGDITALENRVTDIENDYGAANGLATLGPDSKIVSSQLPAIAITDVYVVADIAARDALTVEEGDVAKVTDAGAGLPRTYIYDGSIWIEIESGSDVDSVNGYTGAVLLTASDIQTSAAVSVQSKLSSLESEDLTFLKLDGTRTMSGDFDMGGFNINQAASLTAVSGTAETYVDGFGVNMSDSAGSAQVVLTTQSIDSTEAFTVITQTGALLFQAADSFIELAALDSVKVTAPKLDMGLKDILDAAQLQVVEVAGGATGLVSGLTPGALVVSDNATGKASEINYEQISVDDGTNSIVMTSTAITGSLNLSLETSGALNLTSSAAAINFAASGGIDLSPGAGFEVFIHEQLNMQSAKIVSLADGVAASDAATVGQVDSAISSAVSTINGDISALQAEDLTFLKLDGTRPMTGNLDFDGHDLLNVSDISSVASTNLSIASGNSLSLSSSGNFIVDSQAGLTVNAAGTGAITSNSALTLTSSTGSLYLAAPGVAQQIVAQAEMSLTSKKIVDVAAGTVSTDAVNKGQMESYADQAEADAISSANSYTDGQLDALAVQQLVHESKTLVAGDITNGYIDVAFDIQGQPWVQVGRVSLVPGDDFTISGARITFAGAVASAGAEALEAGDKLSIFYMKSVQPYV